MNKYQKALDNVSAEWGTSDRDIDILQELVEKETPKKVILSNSRYRCPNCDGILAFDYTGICLECQNVRCGGCGQALDWSKIHDKQEL